jgi:hypothetical protein
MRGRFYYVVEETETASYLHRFDSLTQLNRWDEEEHSGYTVRRIKASDRAVRAALEEGANSYFAKGQSYPIPDESKVCRLHGGELPCYPCSAADAINAENKKRDELERQGVSRKQQQLREWAARPPRGPFPSRFVGEPEAERAWRAKDILAGERHPRPTPPRGEAMSHYHFEPTQEETAGLDPNLVEALKRYVEERIETGGFLRSFLENDLLGVLGRCHPSNRAALWQLRALVLAHVPAPAWGSPRAVERWLNTKGDC